ncbi:MAG TPA: DUF4012 domain-containing protein [Ktedonobacteraceae bacterium]|nr:DUF4012 domain-containing protein [Ktedonobacteraceae bacterium]
MATTQVVMPDKGRRPKKRQRVVMIACLFLALLGIVIPIVGYPMFENRYHQDLALAQSGEQYLQTAVALLQTMLHDPFNTATIGTAQHDFSLASTNFTRLNGELSSIPDLLTSIPVYGTRLQAAKHLAPLALEVAQAGLAGCAIVSIIASGFHDPSNKAQGLTMQDIPALNQNIEHIKAILVQAVQQVNHLQPADLQIDPRLSKMVAEFHTYLPLIQQGLGQVEALLTVAPLILGITKPANYLVEILDSTELRPGGGFIGNYGIVTLAGGRLSSAHVIDTYLLDNHFELTHSVSLPSDYSWFSLLSQNWGLRDSNLDADFPTSARNGEMLYQLEGGTLPLAGVIAITPALIERILAITGPIAVPEYHETITAQNLVERIHYHQIIEDAKSGDVPSADGNSSVRKHFTALLGQYFVARLHSLAGSLLPGVLQAVIDSMYTKDIQIYLNAGAAEKVLQNYQLDDSIQSPVGDSIFVVDANIYATKANKYLLTTVEDQVTIDSTGTAIHHTLIKQTWTKAGLKSIDFYGPTRYKDYLRVYLPPNSTLLAQAGWEPKDTGIASGRKFWGGYSSIYYPQTGAITLTWIVAGAAQKDAHGWRYQYLIQHQAGSQQGMNVQITLASCAAITNKSAGIVMGNRQSVYLVQALTQDTKMSIDYTC